MQNHDTVVTAAEMAEIDRLAQERFGIPGIVLMENAGVFAWKALKAVMAGGTYRGAPRAAGGTGEVPRATGGAVAAPRAAGGTPRAVFVAGAGNNGGDALVMARHAILDGNIDVRVVTTARFSTGLAAQHIAILEALDHHPVVWDEDVERCRSLLRDAHWVVDGLTGTGLSGALRQPAASIVDAINDSSALVLSIDVPSGVRDLRRDESTDVGAVVHADVTVVTGYLKSMLYEPVFRPHCGHIHQVDPGFPPALVRETTGRRRSCTLIAPMTADAASRPGSPHHRRRFVGSGEPVVGRIISRHPAQPRAEAHKGTRGRVLVVGGSSGTAGAPILAALAAHASGAGMVRLLGPQQSVGGVVVREPGIMASARPSGDDTEAIASMTAWADAVVLGPGWLDLSDGELARWLAACDERGTPVVVDAAALRVLAGSSAESRHRIMSGSAPVVLTPHPGEWHDLVERRRSSGSDNEAGSTAGLRGDDRPATPFDADAGSTAGLRGDDRPATPFDADAGSTTSLPGRWGELADTVRREALTVVLKDAVTTVRHGDGSVDILDGRCPALGVAGSGDVLSGLIGGSLARLTGVPSVGAGCVADAVRWAVTTHLAAGRACARDKGAFAASDLTGPIARRAWWDGAGEQARPYGAGDTPDDGGRVLHNAGDHGDHGARE